MKTKVEGLQLENMLFSVILTVDDDTGSDKPPIEAQLEWGLTDSYDFLPEECPICGETDPEKFIISKKQTMLECKACELDLTPVNEFDPSPDFEAWPFRSSRKFGTVLTFEEWEKLLNETGMTYECDTLGMIGAPGAVPWYGMLPALSFNYNDYSCRMGAYVCPLPAMLVGGCIETIPGIELPVPEEVLNNLFSEMKEKW